MVNIRGGGFAMSFDLATKLDVGLTLYLEHARYCIARRTRTLGTNYTF